MNKLDLDQDGVVDYNEFLNATCDHSKLISDEANIKYVFNILDINGDGELDIDEFKSMFISGERADLFEYMTKGRPDY